MKRRVLLLLQQPEQFDSRLIGAVRSQMSQDRLAVFRPALTQQLVYMLDLLSLKFDSQTNQILNFHRKRTAFGRFAAQSEIAARDNILSVPGGPFSPTQYQSSLASHTYSTTRSQILATALELASQFDFQEAPPLDLLSLRAVALILLYTVADMHERQNVISLEQYNNCYIYEYKSWFLSLTPDQKKAMNMISPAWFPQFPFPGQPTQKSTTQPTTTSSTQNIVVEDYYEPADPTLSQLLTSLGLSHSHLRRLSGHCVDFY